MDSDRPTTAITPPLVVVLDPVRLAALDAYDILDTAPEKGFDDVVLLARNICDTPVALVSLVAGNRQWFKARIGFPSCETDLNSSVCAHVLSEPDLLIIPDLTLDPRTRSNPLVIGDPHIRFYAGAPLRTPSGETLGSLCVIDGKPRPEGLSAKQSESLRALAGQVMAQMELHRAFAIQRRVLNQREALIRTQATVSASRGDLSVILDALVSGAMEGIPQAEGGVIEVRDGDELVYHATRGTLDQHAGFRVSLHDSLSGSSLLAGEPTLITDVRLDDRVRQDLAADMRLRSCVVLPVWRSGKAVAVLKLQSNQPNAFSQADLTYAQVVAGTVSAGFAVAGEAAARREASRSERRRQAVFDSAIDYAIILLDPNGLVTDWNEGATAILGWQPDEICGRPAATFFTPEDRDAGVPGQEMHSALTEGRGIDERWHLRRDGSRFWANGEMVALRDEDGEPLGFMKILRDRTEQRLTLERLREAEDRLRRAQEAGGVGMFSVGQDGILHPTPAFCRLYGLPERESYPSTAFETLIVPEDAHLVSTSASRQTGEAPRDVEYRIRRPDTGEIRWIARKGELEIDDAGRPMRFVGVSRDITEQRAARDALAESERHWRGLFEQLREGFILGRVIRDDTGRIVDWRYVEVNRAWGELVGVPSGQASGRTIREVFPGIEDDWVNEFADVVESGCSVTFTRQVGTLQRWYEGRAHRLTSETFVVLFLEVSDRVLVDQALRKSERFKAALLELGDRVRGLTSVPEITQAASEITGLTLGATRAGFGLLDATAEHITVEPDWTAPGQVSVSGRHRLDNYGALRDDLLNGKAIAIDDAGTDPRTASNAEALRAIDVVAMANTPVRERGRTGALFFVHDRVPRAWSEEDVAFLRAVADRVEVSIARLRAEQQQHLLNDELSHRMKNILAMVQAIAVQTLRGASDIDTVREVLGNRLIALGKAHDILLGGAAQRARLAAVVREGVGVQEEASGRVGVTGPELEIGGKAALSMGLMLHELTTNAIKYGALSVAEGRVEVTWSLVGPEPALRIVWQENGGPPVTPPMRKGFGSRLIERGITGQVGGTLSLTYPPEGVTCIVEAPLGNFQDEA